MKRVPWLLGVALAGLLAGCQAEKDLNWDYGRSYHAVFDNQKLDPAAGDGSPVTGMPGGKAVLAYDRYEKAEPPKEQKQGESIMLFGNK